MVPLDQAADEVLALKQLPGDGLDEELAAVNNLHASKVRALMTSIGKLEKENILLKRARLDHKRTETFKQLQAELGRQDAIIEALWGRVGDKQARELIRSLPEATGRLKTKEELSCELESRRRDIAVARRALTQTRISSASFCEEGSTMDGASEELAAKLRSMVKEHERHMEMLSKENESLGSLRTSLERELATQREFAVELQREQAAKLPCVRVNVDAELQGRLNTKTNEIELAQRVVVQLQQRLQIKAQQLASVQQEQEETERASSLLREEAEEAKGSAVSAFQEKLVGQRREQEALRQELERKRLQCKETKTECRGELDRLDAERKLLRRQSTEREDNVREELLAQARERRQVASAEHDANAGRRLKSLAAAEARIVAAREECAEMRRREEEASTQCLSRFQECSRTEAALAQARQQHAEEADGWPSAYVKESGPAVEAEAQMGKLHREVEEAGEEFQALCAGARQREAAHKEEMLASDLAAKQSREVQEQKVKEMICEHDRAQDRLRELQAAKDAAGRDLRAVRAEVKRLRQLRVAEAEGISLDDEIATVSPDPSTPAPAPGLLPLPPRLLLVHPPAAILPGDRGGSHRGAAHDCSGAAEALELDEGKSLNGARSSDDTIAALASSLSEHAPNVQIVVPSLDLDGGFEVDKANAQLREELAAGCSERQAVASVEELAAATELDMNLRHERRKIWGLEDYRLELEQGIVRLDQQLTAARALLGGAECQSRCLQCGSSIDR